MAAFQARRALHAGSWYDADGAQLRGKLQGWLDAAASDAARPGAPVGVIAPHAGYSYSGPTAAFAYRHLTDPGVRRVVVLGPSHHYYLEACELSQAQVLQTPVGDLSVDADAGARLAAAAPDLFGRMQRSVDEEEHSIEMHLPYIAHALRGRDDVKVLPILVGNLSPETERRVGEQLAPLLADPSNFFVVSSDFCHWGSRFRFQAYDEACGAIHESIEKLDRAGMQLIEDQDVEGFTAYLKRTRNTICGRHPIGVMLNALRAADPAFGVRFERYAQSSPCKSMSDSSVSYASAVIYRRA